MKNIKYILLLILGLGILFSCKKDDKDPVLDMSQTIIGSISNPQNGATVILVKDSADVPFTFEWSENQYNYSQLVNTVYTLQIDFADSNFKNPSNITTTTSFSHNTTIGVLNNILLGMGAKFNVANTYSLRLYSYINSNTYYPDLYSDVIGLTITPYEDAVEVKAIYLLGSGTTVGWDNAKALKMTHLEDAKYAIVDHLTPGDGQYIKFISVLTQWAPQWGTDATGLPEAGPLIYRPNETIPDPDAIPVGDIEGNYYIVADTIGLTYETILTSGDLFLVGAGCNAGWNNDQGIPFIQDPDTLTKFSLVTDLKASGGLKFLEVNGEWAPQWGSYNGGFNGGTLSYRPNETVADPPEIPVPGSPGQYIIEVNMQKMKYTIKPN